MKYLMKLENFTEGKIYLKTYENTIVDKPKIGDEIVCTGYSVFDVKSNKLLEHGRTYIIENIMVMGGKGKKYIQYKLKNVDYWWESERFKFKKNLSQQQIDYYDDIVTKLDSKKYNL